MSTLFTPGPWLASKQRKYAYLHGEIVSHLARIDVSGPEGAANARLIAAAPDLYAALRWALDYGDFNVAEDNPMHARAFDEARAVLAKIERP